MGSAPRRLAAADDDWQEEEHRRAHGVDEVVGVGGLDDDLVLHEQRQEPLEDSGGRQHAHHRDHRAGDDADEGGEAELDPAPQGGGPLDELDVSVLLASAHVGQLGDDGVVDVDDVGADDDLVLAAGLGHVDDAVEIGHGLIICQGLVLEVEAHARDAVQDGADVVGASDAGDDVGGGGIEAGEAIGALSISAADLDPGARGASGCLVLPLESGGGDGGTSLRLPGGHGQAGQVGDRIGQDHDGSGGFARGADGLEVHGAQGIAGLDGVSDLNAQIEGGALELDGVDAEVKQDLQAGLALEADGVAGAGDHGDGGVHRGDYRAVVGLDAEPVPHGLGGEDGVGDVG